MPTTQRQLPRFRETTQRELPLQEHAAPARVPGELPHHAAITVPALGKASASQIRRTRTGAQRSVLHCLRGKGVSSSLQ